MGLLTILIIQTISILVLEFISLDTLLSSKG